MIARDAWRRRDEDHVLHEPEPLAGRQVGEQLKRVPHDASAERDPEQRERAAVTDGRDGRTGRMAEETGVFPGSVL